MRNCYRCGIEYPKYRSRPSNDGKFRCRPCNIELRSIRYEQSTKGKKTTLKWREQHRDEAKKRAKKWAEENPERRKEIEKKYAKSYKGLAAGLRRSTKHYWLDPEFQRKKAIARNHRVTPDFITELRKRQPICQLCGTNSSLTVDHMNPVSNGGKAIESNIQSLCGPCNSWKSNKLFLANGSGYIVEINSGRT